MSASEDIRNLFGKFEGQAQHYQEVSRENQAGEARTRWPLLLSIALDESDRVPDVGDPAAPVAGGRPVPQTQTQSQASRESAPAFRVQNGPARTAAALDAAPSAAPNATPNATPPARSGPEAGHAAASPGMPPLLRPRPDVPAVHYPPVVTPETSTRHSPDARDFAPAVVPVNHFAPGSSTLSAPERDPRADALPAPRASILGRTTATARQMQSATATQQSVPAVQPRSAATQAMPAAPPTRSAVPQSVPAALQARSAATPAMTSAPPAMTSAPRSSILGKMFAPAIADEGPAPQAGDRDAAATRPSRDLQAIFSRLDGGKDRKRSQ
jgi:hypothetical protein